jgi:hypothetical protein
MLGALVGGVFGIPAIVLAIAAIWKGNRHPYALLKWFFWISLLLAVSKFAHFAATLRLPQ